MLVLRALIRPANLFIAMSLLFGLTALGVTPPLRGPDENAHFLRAYGFARGAIIATARDPDGRLGLEIPARLYWDFSFFDRARERAAMPGFSYRDACANYATPQDIDGDRLVFTPFGGSEAYSPVPYLPYVLAAALGDIAGLGFLPLLYLMRLAGLLASTIIIALAIERTPLSPWGFFAVAMLPSSLFARATISADGAVLATTLMIVALCLRSALQLSSASAERGLWFGLSALTKPSQIAMLPLELMSRPGKFSRGRLLTFAAVTIPAGVLALSWTMVAGADIGSWRLHEGGRIPPEQFQVGWKMRFMLDHPLHVPTAILASLDYAPELWRQLIGVLGWLDTPLNATAYVGLTVFLLASLLHTIPLPAGERMQVSLVAFITALVYALFVFVLLFLTSTPVESERVLGLQGRYFVPIMPLVAIAVAGLVPRQPAGPLAAMAATALGMLSGAALVEAALRADWSPLCLV